MPGILEPPKNVAPTQDRQPTLVHRIAVNLARLVMLVAIAVSFSGGWYLAKRVFGRQWRYRVVEELHKRGVEASIGRLTLDPFRGLVAKNVRIFDYKNREKTLARISEVSLDVNYAALIHHEPFLNALDVRNAQITLPLKNAEGTINGAQFNDLRAHVYFPPEQIYVSQAEGVFCGVRISATGQLIKRANYQPSPPVSEEEWRRGLAILERIVKELQKFSFPAAPPSLQVKFSGICEIECAGRGNMSGDRLQRSRYREASALPVERATFEYHTANGMIAGAVLPGVPIGTGKAIANFQMRRSLDLKIFSMLLILRPLRGHNVLLATWSRSWFRKFRPGSSSTRDHRPRHRCKFRLQDGAVLRFCRRFFLGWRTRVAPRCPPWTSNRPA
jgi:hypothetical protein